MIEFTKEELKTINEYLLDNYTIYPYRDLPIILKGLQEMGYKITKELR